MTILSSRPFRAFSFLLTLLLVSTTATFAGVQAIDDCAAVGRKVKSAVAKDPTKVLVIVEDSLTAHPDCACEIVKGAIVGAEADNDLVKQIVITAVTSAQEKAAEIAECAVHAAPDAAKAVKAGLEAALGEVVDDSSKTAPFVGAPVGANGIFLLSPIGPSASFSDIQIVPAGVSSPNPAP